MKKFLLFIMLAVTSIAYWSCNSDDADLLAIGGGVIGDSIVIQPPIALKTFENSWETYDSVYNLAGKKIGLPWNKKGITGYINTQDARDVRRNDGWRYIQHQLAGSGSEDANYIILYNDITGMMKIFVYCFNANPVHNNAIWRVMFNPETDGADNGLFAAMPEVALPYQVRKTEKAEYIVAAGDAKNAFSVANGWNIVKIPLTYDPSTQEINIKIHAQAYTLSDLSLDVDLESIVSGTFLSSFISSDDETGPVDVTKSHDSTKSFLNQFFTTAGSMVEDPSMNNIIGKGLSFIGNAFFGQSSEEPNGYIVNLKIKTTGTINGKSVTPMLPGPTTIDRLIVSSESNSKLGAWTLMDYPTIYIHPLARIKAGYNAKEDEHVYWFRATGNTKVKLALNPELEKHVVSKKVECVPVYYNAESDSTGRPEPLTRPDYSGLLCCMDQGLSYQITPVSRTTIYGALQSTRLESEVSVYGMKSKYGPNRSRSDEVWQYIYMPREEKTYSRTPVKYNMRKVFAKVTVTLVTNFNGERKTTVMTRTYCPRIEWDPEYVALYKNMDMDQLQNYGAHDHIANDNE